MMSTTRARFLPALEQRPCAVCGGPIRRRRSQVRAQAPTCSIACRRAQAAGRRTQQQREVLRRGYVYVRVGAGVPGATKQGYKLRARLVVERRLGRILERGEQIVHLDGNRQNDAPDNLAVRRVTLFGDGPLS